MIPDEYFPNMIQGNPSDCPWQYLRREIPHRWLVDRGAPSIGFVNRDEAAIIYNTALRFRGSRALEIGSWLGWSTFHLALAGVSLDVLDPALSDDTIRQAVENCLLATGVRYLVNLIPGKSPHDLPKLAGGRKWSLFLVDGDHDWPSPMRDVEACADHAAADALILMHDLAAPAVWEAFDWLGNNGWKTVVYQTMQIMGAAWRGTTAPVRHIPDPAVNWEVPSHLRSRKVRWAHEV